LPLPALPHVVRKVPQPELVGIVVVVVFGSEVEVTVVAVVLVVLAEVVVVVVDVGVVVVVVGGRVVEVVAVEDVVVERVVELVEDVLVVGGRVVEVVVVEDVFVEEVVELVEGKVDEVVPNGGKLVVVVVLASATHTQASVQTAPGSQPMPASHCSPLAMSNMPSPHVERRAANGFLNFDLRAIRVPVMIEHVR